MDFSCYSRDARAGRAERVVREFLDSSGNGLRGTLRESEAGGGVGLWAGTLLVDGRFTSAPYSRYTSAPGVAVVDEAFHRPCVTILA
jgi:hypothetical protein